MADRSELPQVIMVGLAERDGEQVGDFTICLGSVHSLSAPGVSGPLHQYFQMSPSGSDPFHELDESSRAVSTMTATTATSAMSTTGSTGTSSVASTPASSTLRSLSSGKLSLLQLAWEQRQEEKAAAAAAQLPQLPPSPCARRQQQQHQQHHRRALPKAAAAARKPTELPPVSIEEIASRSSSPSAEYHTTALLQGVNLDELMRQAAQLSTME